MLDTASGVKTGLNNPADDQISQPDANIMDGLPSPGLSAIPSSVSSNVVEEPKVQEPQRPSLVGQRTQMLLQEMGDDLQGMGFDAMACGDNFDMLDRQPTAFAKDPAMMTV